MVELHLLGLGLAATGSASDATAAALRLGRRGVLAQEPPAVKGLARVDALCTDKTGTTTDGPGGTGSVDRGRQHG
jgi:cation transport ATPase